MDSFSLSKSPFIETISENSSFLNNDKAIADTLYKPDIIDQTVSKQCSFEGRGEERAAPLSLPGVADQIMSQLSSLKGKGKERSAPVSEQSSTSQTNQPLSLSPQRQTPTQVSEGSSAAGPSSSTFLPTQGTKRKVQSSITSFFPSKKQTIEPIQPPPTIEDNKAAKKKIKETKRAEETAARNERNAAKAEAEKTKEAKRAEETAARDERKAAKAEAKKIKEAKRAEDNAARVERNAEKKLKKESREAEKARKKDWKDWVQQHVRLDATFKIEQDEKWLIIRECKVLLGIQRDEVDCLEHCHIDNPFNPDKFAALKVYRRVDVERLAWRKEAIMNGVVLDDEKALLEEGKRLCDEKQIPKKKPEVLPSQA